jgi:hypothetical protein
MTTTIWGRAAHLTMQQFESKVQATAIQSTASCKCLMRLSFFHWMFLPLHHRSVSGNQLHSTLPASWSLLLRLRLLNASHNPNLMGPLPPAWSTLTSLQIL